MTGFIGRKEELEVLNGILKKKTASIIVIKGRRRIGKSRLIDEFVRQNKFDALYLLSGVAPNKKTTAQSQRNEFASQLHKAGFPKITAEDWNDLLWLLADKVRHGRVLIVLDEISWMGNKDPDFLGKIKNAWDLHFKKNNKLILIFCGSISTWIEENILSSTGFLGRISIDLSLQELPLFDCSKFWGRKEKSISSYEKFKILSVTGGIPLYLEHIDPDLTAEENIRKLCFMPHGLLFEEFEKVFSDLFSKKSNKYKKIVQALVAAPTTQEYITQVLEIKRSGDIKNYLDNLIKSGFVSRDFSWRMSDGKNSSLSHYRLSDNYSRFYLKYILPNREKIINKQFSEAHLNDFPGWSSIMGLQFENLVLNNRRLIWKLLKIKPEEIICDNPFFQRKTNKQPGCQVDYMIQTKYNVLYIFEIKFSKNSIHTDIINDMQNKIENLQIPKHFSYRAILIHVNGVKEEIIDRDFFSAIINFGEFLSFQ
jgi:uncharacterized protein